jgi:hypothetical protein
MTIARTPVRAASLSRASNAAGTRPVRSTLRRTVGYREFDLCCTVALDSSHGRFHSRRTSVFDIQHNDCLLLDLDRGGAAGPTRTQGTEGVDAPAPPA